MLCKQMGILFYSIVVVMLDTYLAIIKDFSMLPVFIHFLTQEITIEGMFDQTIIVCIM